MNWLRARTHLFAPVVLALALTALAVDWMLGTHTRQESLAYAILGGGGLALLLLKLRDMRRRRGR